MFKTLTRALLIGLSMTLTFGCADENLYQFGLRGKWQLETSTAARRDRTSAALRRRPLRVVS